MPSSVVRGDPERLLSQLDRLGRGFERLARWFLLNDPEYAEQVAHVWLWNDWPGRWGIDKGIDLIIETTDGRIIAVQAKHYDLKYSITKHDVDRFLSESNRAAIDERLLIATTERLAANAREVMDGQQKPVHLCLRSRLLESYAAWPASLDLLKPAAPELKRPEPHQVEALDAITAGLRVADRGQVIMACGTGKSLIALWSGEQLNAELTLVLAPSIALLRQTAQLWAAQQRQPAKTLKVCSDTTRDADAEGFSLDSAELGGNTTTDPAVIARFLQTDGRRVIFSTYQSSGQIADAMAAVPGARFDLAICDEAHWCAGLEGRTNKTILDDSRIPARKRLFMTATPVLYHLKDVENMRRRRIQIASMHDARLFGRVLHRLSLASAIDRNILCPYQVVVMPVSDEEVQRLILERVFVTVDGGDTKNDAYSLATQIACARAMRSFDCRRMVSYHPRIDRSRAFSEQFTKAVDLLPQEQKPGGEVVARHIDGDRMPKAARHQTLREFSRQDDRHWLLSNVKLLAEGVDVPGIDAVTLVDTERSAQQVVQILGRAVRRAEGKTVGTVVLPVLVRGDESFDEAMARSEHRPILHLLAALRAADPEIERSLDDLRVQVGPDGWPSTPRRRFVIDAPQEVGPEFAEAVEVMLVDQLAPSRRSTTTDKLHSQNSTRREGEDDAPVVVDFEPPDWTDPAVLEQGLEVLERTASGRLMPAPRPYRPYGPFPLAQWWDHVLTMWSISSPDQATKRRIAAVVTCLSIDRSEHPRVRKDLTQLSAASIPEHIHASLEDRWGGEYDLARLYEAGIIGERDEYTDVHGILETARIHRALTHPSMPFERQVDLVRHALLVAGREARDRKSRASFADGFATALEEYPRPCPVEGKPAGKDSSSLAGQYVAGWSTAQPLFPLLADAIALRALTVPDGVKFPARAPHPARRAA